MESIRAASPGCGVITRNMPSKFATGGNQSSALASATIGNSLCAHNFSNSFFNGSGKSIAANPGPNKIALHEFGKFFPLFHGCTIAACNCDATGTKIFSCVQ